MSGHGEWPAWNAFRTGDANNLKGPVAQTNGWGGPPTATNSYVWLQMVNGTMLKDMTLGWARTFAVTAIEAYFPNFNVTPGNQEMYRHVKTDIDLQGDPGIQPWKGVPRRLQAAFPQSVAPNVSTIEVRVTTPQGNAAPGELVCLYAPGAIPLNNVANYAAWNNLWSRLGRTDGDGVARFSLEGHQLTANSRVYVTVTGRDVVPAMGEITVSVPRSVIDLSAFSIREVEGNRNDIPNPGEVLDITLTARNSGNQDAVNGVRCSVTSLSQYADVGDDDIAFGDLAAGRERQGDAPVRVTLSPDCPDAESRPLQRPRLLLTFTDGNTVWKSVLIIEPAAPHLELRSIQPGAVIQPRVSEIDFDLNNVGAIASGNFTGRLVSMGMGVTVVRQNASWANIGAGGHARIQGDKFTVSGNQVAVPGSTCPMLLLVTSQAGFVDSIWFNLQIGQPRANAPQGPDDYGYIAFDNTDAEWDMAPDYDWIEINPNDNNNDYDGTRINFQGQAQFDIGECRVINLGFRTKFYGEDFRQITVATNGFIAMGDQGRITNFQNWRMDEAIGGGMGMLAPLWDDLRLTQNSGIFTFRDEETGRFIIQWNRMTPANGQGEFTFEVVIYDADVWITETGNPNILFQYKTVSSQRNVRNGDTEWVNNIPFASIGISSPDGTTGLNYYFNNTAPVTSAQLADRRAILFSTSPRFRSGVIYGQVTDLETGDGIEEAIIVTQHGFVAYSDENGIYRIEGALAGVDFSITASRQGYNDSTLLDNQLAEDDSVEINFALRHPEFRLSRNRIEASLLPDEVSDIPFRITNAGNGPLTWNVTRRLIGEADRSPWELRRVFDISRIIGDDRLEGVVYIDGNYYLSGSNGNDTNKIWVMSEEGELVRSFNQHGISRYGYRDLEWDGELIWGSNQDTVFAFTPEGELVHRWRGPLNPNIHLAWDTDGGVLYLSGITTGIYRYDRDGNQIAGAIDRRLMRIYGLGYWKDDPDGYPLYVVDMPTGLVGSSVIHKINPATTDTATAHVIRTPRATTYMSGCSITNELDVYSWVMLTIANIPPDSGGDQLHVYQLDARRDWFELDRYSGTLWPEEMQNMVLTFDSENLPPVPFEGELYFTHNADSGTAIVSVRLEVTENPNGRERRWLNFAEGWNFVSLNIVPIDIDVPVMFESLVRQGLVELVKDGRGRFYRPGNNFNSIPFWNSDEGYMVYATRDTSLEVRGRAVEVDHPLHLTAGWNLASYVPREPLNPVTAVSGIVNDLIIAKDGLGRFYIPEYDYCNMLTMQEGIGYYYKMAREADLVYTVGQELAAAPVSLEPNEHFISPLWNGGENHSLLLVGFNSRSGMEVAVRNNTGELLGAGRFDANGRAGFAIWGDNPETAAVDGATANEPFSLVIWDGEREMPLQVRTRSGELKWSIDGVTIAVSPELQPVEFGIAEAYPNPFNSSVRLKLGLAETGRIKLAIYDIAGREIAQLFDGELAAGMREFYWNAASASAGVYFARLEQNGRRDIRKLMLVK
jgi:hypothetical protein